jgi:membrane protein DedA with SNARE-associated domain
MVLTASVYAGATHRLEVALVIAAAAGGAFCGDNLSFLLGRRGGYPLLRRYGRFIHIDRDRRRIGQYLYQRHGGIVVVSGRFVPILHIATAFLAGVNAMSWPRFLVFDIVGCAIWATALGSVGYVFGSRVLAVGGAVLGISLPLAAGIVVAIVIVLRRMEKRLQQAADDALAGTDDDVA